MKYINYWVDSTITGVELAGFTAYSSGMATSTRSKAARARRVWQLMFDFLISTGSHRTEVLGRFGLTPNDSRALSTLSQEDGRTMSSLADEWRCDASNATWIVDRLERAGLAVRRDQPNDRRVKLVLLTAKGARLKAELMEAFYAPPAELLALDAADLTTLQRLLERLPGTSKDG